MRIYVMHETGIVYMDNAATSWPKPDSVLEEIDRFYRQVGANPGRSGHRLSVEAERIRMETREALSSLLGNTDPLSVVFTANVTAAVSLVLLGYLRPGDRVVTTSMEHNSVLRPLRYLEKNRDIRLTMVEAGDDGSIDPEDFGKAITGDERLAVVTHASNVCGTILPIHELGKVTSECGIPLMVDAAQTAGCCPLDMEADAVDILAFTGHKGLLGPTGTGGLIFGPGFDTEAVTPLAFGGTGSRSEKEEQPDFMPDRFESGTANIGGIAGLGAGVRWISERGVDVIREHEVLMTRRLLDGLKGIRGVKIFGPADERRQTATVSFVVEGMSVSEVGMRLSDEYEIMSRVGLHCAPRAHRTLGTFPEGTVRFSMGPFTTDEDIDTAVEAVARITRKK